MIQAITTERLILRPFSLADAKAIYDFSREKGLGEWMPDQVYKDEEEATEVIKFLIAQYSSPIDPSKKPFVLGIMTKANELIGHVGLSPRKTDVEIGYAIGENYLGKGYATEAVESMAQWALQNLSLEKIIAVVAKENHSSIRVLQKAGFRLHKEVEMLYHGRNRQCQEYEFLRR